MTSTTFTARQAASMANVHPRTLQRWCRERRVAHCRTAGGHFRFTQDQVDQLVELVTPVEDHPEVDAPNPWRDELEVVAPLPTIARGRRVS